jgi:hypothetical protein
MPGHYVEELRKMTRAQGGGGEAPPPSVGAPEGGGALRRHGAFIALAVVLVLAGVGWLVVRQLVADAKLQDCVMSGRKNCAPVEVDSSGR